MSELNSKIPKLPDYVRVISILDVNGRSRNLCVPASLDLDRPKKPRTVFTTEQLTHLELEFVKTQFLSAGNRRSLSKYLGLSETQVKVWFQNRRTKLRKCSSVNLKIKPTNKIRGFPNYSRQDVGSKLALLNYPIPQNTTYNPSINFSLLQNYNA